jgi:hypothetical protein
MEHLSGKGIGVEEREARLAASAGFTAKEAIIAAGRRVVLSPGKQIGSIPTQKHLSVLQNGDTAADTGGRR